LENRDGYKKKPKSSISCLVGVFFVLPFQFCDIENLANFFKYVAKLVEFSLKKKKKTKNFPFFFLGWNKQNFFCRNEQNCCLVFKRHKYCIIEFKKYHNFQAQAKHAPTNQYTHGWKKTITTRLWMNLNLFACQKVVNSIFFTLCI
jgi:hypothetical protein